MGAPHKMAATSAIVVACCSFLSPNEGMRTVAYQDPATIWTICYGETLGVQPGQRKTPAECRQMLGNRIPDYLLAVDRSVKQPMPDSRRIALTDFAYNAGVRAYQRSGIPARLNAGDVAGGCSILKKYVWAGRPKRKLPGLVTRRDKEYQLCMQP